MKTELPVKKTKRRPLNNPYIVDNLGVLICMCYDEEQADYIVQAINSHEKLVKALEVISDHEDIRKKVSIGYDAIVDEYTKQALKEVEK